MATSTLKATTESGWTLLGYVDCPAGQMKSTMIGSIPSSAQQIRVALMQTNHTSNFFLGNSVYNVGESDHIRQSYGVGSNSVMVDYTISTRALAVNGYSYNDATSGLVYYR